MGMAEKNAERLARLNESPILPKEASPASKPVRLGSDSVSSSGFVKKIKRRKRRLKARQNSNAMLENHLNVDKGAYLPSQEEIAYVTSRIRAGWTARERESRCQLPKATPVSIPMVHTSRS